MHKCDSCGKVVVNEQDYMCPHCGAVSNKHCGHNTHLPDDKYFRVNDYKTNSAEYKTKTYDYEKAPKTSANQGFDINDLANVKNAEDVKKIAKKAFVEQDKNGKKKFKPIAVVLIVIIAFNIFSSVMGVVVDTAENVFDEIEEVFSIDDVENYEDLYGVSVLEESIYTDYDTVYSYSGCANVESAYLDTAYDVLEIQLSGIGFNQLSITTEEQGYSYQQLVEDSHVAFFDVAFITTEAISEYEDSEDTTDNVLNYADHAKFKGNLYSDGILEIEGIASKLDEYYENVFIEITNITVLTGTDNDCCYKGDYNITPNIIRLDSYNNCNFYEYYDIADESLSKEHYEMVTTDDAAKYDFNDVADYSEIIEF